MRRSPRRELSASIARDNTLLTERSRIMETLGALLDAINHASTEQRQAIDALVASSAALLERAGARFSDSGIDGGIEQSAPVFAVFGDLMAGLLGAFVLILVGVVGVQLELASDLEAEVHKRRIAEQRREALRRRSPCRWRPAA